MPKGGVERGESWYDAAVREIVEETGLAADGLSYIYHLGTLVRVGLTAEKTDQPSVEKHIEMGLFVVRQTVELCPLGTDVVGASWVPLGQAVDADHPNALSWPEERRFVLDHSEQIRMAIAA